MISDPIKIANEFNEYFSTIDSQLHGKIYHYGQDYLTYLKNYKHIVVLLHQIIKVINSFNSNKATGPHRIPTHIIHLIKVIIAKPLSELILYILYKDAIFERLKTIPTFKESNVLRPIILSNINKIIEN